MLAFGLRRFGVALFVAFAVSVISFGLLYLSGDLAIALAGETSDYAQIEAIRKQYGLDRPIAVQYLDWLTHALRGDFGQSMYFKTPVKEMLAERLPVTMTLGVTSMLFAVTLGIPLGVLAAIRPNSWIDRFALTFSVVGQALPSFWFALILIVFLSLTFPLLPASGDESWENFIMPTIVLGYNAAPAIMRLTRTGMLEVLSSDYIRTARAKGLRAPKVLFKHALRNAVIPVVSLAAVQFGFMLGGSVVVETIFALHGTGFMAWEAIKNNDFPTV
ncbi:MAG: ABC transporter permease, partial [Rhodospirillaceae bacterium]|nr:ABC transporter permease [Rhodospirillaceae bacterium]